MEKLKSQIIEEQIDALMIKGKSLRDDESIFIKQSGVFESIEQYKVEISRTEIALETKKEELVEFKTQKSDAVRNSLIRVQDRITELLPEGDGVVHINDGSFIIGWMLPNKPLVPYEGLSGGQKVIFGRALSKALLGDAENKILIYEAAEVDPPNLIAMLERIILVTNESTQVIVNTWFRPMDVLKGWNVIDFEPPK